jgi:hypothetical protein
MPAPHKLTMTTDPNHRQAIALERIEFAISDLATVLLSCSRSREAVQQAIAGARAAVAPLIVDILSDD